MFPSLKNKFKLPLLNLLFLVKYLSMFSRKIKDKRLLLNCSSLMLAVLCASLLWVSPTYFTPDTFFNPGDAVFPYNPERALFDRLVPWNPSGSSGYGNLEVYNPPLASIFVGSMRVLDSIGFPLWLSNRLYFLIPSVLECFSILFLLNSLGYKLSAFVRFTGAFFFLTSFPMTFLDPLLHLCISGMIFASAALYNELKSSKITNAIVIALSFLLMSSMIRYLALYLIFAVLLSIYFPIQQEEKWRNIKRILSVNGKALLLYLPFLVFTFFPYVINIFHVSDFQLLSSAAKSSRLSVIDFFGKSTLPNHIIRLTYDQRYSMAFNFYKLPYFYISSCVVLFLMMSGMKNVVRQNNQEVKPLAKIMVTLLLFTLFFGTDLHKALVGLIPGIWIMNNPQYGLTLVAALFTIFLVIGLDTLVKRVRLSTAQLNYRMLFLVAICFGAIVLNNAMLIFDIRVSDIKSSNLQSGKLEVTRGIGNHSKQFLIPNDYAFVADPKNGICNYSNALLVPDTANGYYKYKFFHENMRPILDQHYCFNFIDLNRLERELFNRVQTIYKNNDASAFREFLVSSNVRYLLVSLDVDVEIHLRPLLRQKISFIDELSDLKVVFSGDNLKIYEFLGSAPILFTGKLNKKNPNIRTVNDIRKECFLSNVHISRCFDIHKSFYNFQITQLYRIKNLDVPDGKSVLFFTQGRHGTWALMPYAQENASIFKRLLLEINLMLGTKIEGISKEPMKAEISGGYWTIIKNFQNRDKFQNGFVVVNRADMLRYPILTSIFLILWTILIIFLLYLTESRETRK